MQFHPFLVVTIAVKDTKSVYIFKIGTDEGPMLETLDHTIRIGSTPTFLYFDLYIYIGQLPYLYQTICKHVPVYFSVLFYKINFEDNL